VAMGGPAKRAGPGLSLILKRRTLTGLGRRLVYARRRRCSITARNAISLDVEVIPIQQAMRRMSGRSTGCAVRLVIDMKHTVDEQARCVCERE